MSFLLLVGFIVADIMVSMWFGRVVGGWMLLLWFVMAFFLGRQIMRGATKELAPQLQQAQQGQTLDPNTNFLAAMCQALAGFLFILPSMLTDVVAVLLLLPPVQKVLVAWGSLRLVSSRRFLNKIRLVMVMCLREKQPMSPQLQPSVLPKSTPQINNSLYFEQIKCCPHIFFVDSPLKQPKQAPSL